jgi:hypothetical protein
VTPNTRKRRRPTTTNPPTDESPKTCDMKDAVTESIDRQTTPAPDVMFPDAWAWSRDRSDNREWSVSRLDSEAYS